MAPHHHHITTGNNKYKFIQFPICKYPFACYCEHIVDRATSIIKQFSFVEGCYCDAVWVYIAYSVYACIIELHREVFVSFLANVIIKIDFKVISNGKSFRAVQNYFLGKFSLLWKLQNIQSTSSSAVNSYASFHFSCAEKYLTFLIAVGWWWVTSLYIYFCKLFAHPFLCTHHCARTDAKQLHARTRTQCVSILKSLLFFALRNLICGEGEFNWKTFYFINYTPWGLLFGRGLDGPFSIYKQIVFL